MPLMNAPASMELSSGLRVPGAVLMPITNSSMATAGDARRRPTRNKRRRNIGAQGRTAALRLSLLSAAETRPRPGRAATVVGRPLLGRLEEGARLGEALLVEVLALGRRFKRVPPGGE